jgi:hypothetical protein
VCPDIPELHPSARGANGRARILLTQALENVSDRASPATTAWIAARHAEQISGRPRQTGAIRDPARRAAAPITEFAGIHPLPAVYLTLQRALGDLSGYWSRRASLSAGEAR